MDPKNKKNTATYQNPVEAVRDIGEGVTESLRSDLFDGVRREVGSQLFGFSRRNFSGEIVPGESIEMRKILTGEQMRVEHEQKKLVFEKRLMEEEMILVERKTNELRLQIRAIHEEVLKIAKATPKLERELEIAAIQVPVDSSTYELFFLERILEFIASFRKKIEQASVWLMSANRRSAKKNAWGANYKKHGAKYLLSGEHYLSRSSA